MNPTYMHILTLKSDLQLNVMSDDLIHVVFQVLIAYARSRHEPERAPRQQGSGSRSQHSFQMQAGPTVVSSQRNYSPTATHVQPDLTQQNLLYDRGTPKRSMVRETRHLWVGNLPENVREEKIVEHFKR